MQGYDINAELSWSDFKIESYEQSKFCVTILIHNAINILKYKEIRFRAQVGDDY